MNSIRTTIGGAFTALGTALMGIGIVPQLQGAPNPFLTKVAFAGFICQATGTFLTALFAADARQVKQHTAEIEQLKTDTQIITKP